MKFFYRLLSDFQDRRALDGNDRGAEGIKYCNRYQLHIFRDIFDLIQHFIESIPVQPECNASFFMILIQPLCLCFSLLFDVLNLKWKVFFIVHPNCIWLLNEIAQCSRNLITCRWHCDWMEWKRKRAHDNNKKLCLSIIEKILSIQLKSNLIEIIWHPTFPTFHQNWLRYSNV